ncbi:MAG: Ig-like domain-containing protein [Pirellulaceae bacterium]
MRSPRNAAERFPYRILGHESKRNSPARRVRGRIEALEPRMLLAADLLGDIEQPAAPHALFAPGTPAEYVALFEQHDLHNDESAASRPAEYQAANRWEETTSDGGGLDWGDATTLTWSIVPDGTWIPGFVGESAASSKFVSFMKSLYGSTSGSIESQPWFPLIVSVFDRWSEVSGLTFVYEPHDDGAAFSNVASTAPGEAGVRGDIRIGGHAIDGASGTLAYNFFPNNGEMILDTSDSFFSNTADNSLRLRNVMAHELGHGIGLSHVDPVEQTKLMEPFASTAFDGPQHDDILAAQRLYGDEFEKGAGNDSISKAVSLGAIGNSRVTIGDHEAEQYVSIDGAGDRDYFSFVAGAGSILDATLTPLGGTYLSGGQDGSVSSFNSKTQNNLRLAIYDADLQLVASASSRGLGGAESLADIALTAGGKYYARILGDRDAAQFYQLQLDVSGGDLQQAIDFRDFSIDAYGGSQDHSGSAVIDSSGAALHLTGNRWKKIDFTYTITPDTVLEFDFASTRRGDVHGIGFDSNTSISEGLTFRLYGAQDWGLDDFATYKSSSGLTHFVIPVGQYYTGKATSLVFVNDHDVSNPTAESVFRNVRVYESDGATLSPSAPTAGDDRITVNEDSPRVSFDPLGNDDGGGRALSITGVSAGTAGGEVSFEADQRIRYKPAADFYGTETFTYTVSNGMGTSKATVTVNVRAMNDPPVANDNRYAIADGGRTYGLNVLNNDSTGDDAGETLRIVSVGKGSAGGKITIDGDRLLYKAAVGFRGVETFTYTINDGTSGSYDTATVTVNVKATSSAAIDFGDVRIDSYGGAQDFVGAALVEDGGAALRLLGNTWKKIDINYTITPDTVLALDFSSTAQGDVHGIGLDTNNTITASRTFRLYGRQNWGVGSYDTYTSGTKHFVIPIGRYYTGPVSNLFFVNDHDVANPTAESVFRNVRLYEASSSTSALLAQATARFTSKADAASAATDAPSAVSMLERLLLDAQDSAPVSDHIHAAPLDQSAFSSNVWRDLVSSIPSTSLFASSPSRASRDLLIDEDRHGQLDDPAVVDEFFALLGGL